MLLGVVAECLALALAAAAGVFVAFGEVGDVARDVDALLAPRHAEGLRSVVVLPRWGLSAGHRPQLRTPPHSWGQWVQREQTSEQNSNSTKLFFVIQFYA